MNILLSWCRERYQTVFFKSSGKTIKQYSAIVALVTIFLLVCWFIAQTVLHRYSENHQASAVASDESDQFAGLANISSPHSSLITRQAHSMSKLQALSRLTPGRLIVADARYQPTHFSKNVKKIMAQHIAQLYHVPMVQIDQVVDDVFRVARTVDLDPFLILGVIAVESSFNVNAQNNVGAKGLMQVLAKLHQDKFDYFGGMSQVLKPDVNIKVGALILKDCIARAGSIKGGLRLYVGAVATSSAPYSRKVLAMRDQFKSIAHQAMQT